MFPKSVFKRAKAAQGGGEYLLAVCRDGSKPLSRVRVGVYDCDILCQECEHKYHGIDTRGVRSLFQSPYKNLKVYGKRQLIQKYSDEANARDIRVFLYFTLLKACWSNREIYSNVSLEPEVEKHFRETLVSGVEPKNLSVPIFLVQHGIATRGFLPTPAIFHGLITVIPRVDHIVYQVSVGELCAWVFAGKGAPQFGDVTGHLALRDGKRVSILRSPESDTANENWIAQLIADRIGSGGDRWTTW